MGKIPKMTDQTSLAINQALYAAFAFKRSPPTPIPSAPSCPSSSTLLKHIITQYLCPLAKTCSCLAPTSPIKAVFSPALQRPVLFSFI